MTLIWVGTLIAGLVVASLASRRAVTHALTVAGNSKVSPAFVGMTVMAIGTDLPEIANSIISAVTEHGDLNVGDSAGSALTQVTLVLGILCLATTLRSERRTILGIGGVTVAALGLIALLIADGVFGRSDGLLLIGMWVVALLVLHRVSSPPEAAPATRQHIGRDVLATSGWLAVVAVSATIVVQSFVALTEALGVPEVLAGAVVLALGTSLPELIVDWTALRQGAAALALGDLFGSSMLDATLAIGIGPAIAPTLVSDAAVTTCIIAAAGVAIATAVASGGRAIGRRAAAALFATYGACTAALIGFAH